MTISEMIVVGFEQASVLDSVCIVHAQDLDTDEVWRVVVEHSYFPDIVAALAAGEDVYIDPPDYAFMGCLGKPGKDHA